MLQIDLLIFSHLSSPLPVNPSMQVQVIVLNGKLSYTLHSAFWTHGWKAVHGFLQSPLLFVIMHACLLGHSLSILHPSSMTGSGTKFENKIYMILYILYKTQIKKFVKINYYLEYRPHHMDHQWNLVGMCKFLCDF